MLLSKDRNSDPTSENVEQEDKVKVEEASVNLGYMKKELNEEELASEHKQYKIALTLENVFGESSTKQRRNLDGLIGFLDGDVIMKIETGTVKLEEENKDLIQKNMEQSDCNKCGGNYHGYCVNCSSLSHILNNLTPNFNPEPVLNTTPTNIIEIREVSRGCAVFALKTLPKGIILGPFEGIAPIESTTGLQWKIKDKKFVNDENGNWMKYIQTVANHASKNLDVFQIDGILNFETCREIQEGEELLVCYGTEGKEEMLESDKKEVFYLVPMAKDRYPKVFACTLCCLGFRLESCLVEHKSKCPHRVNMEDFEIMQCRCCKVWLEKQEHLESHMLHCRENYNRSCRNRNLPEFPPSIDDVNASYSTLPTEPIDSNNCFSRTDFKVQKDFYDKNMGTIPSNTNEKEYKCSQCSFQTNRKGDLKTHLGTHTNHFQCDVCKQRFGYKSSLKVHIKNKHSNTNEKEYKCSECSFQTNRKNSLKAHLGRHTMHLECDICKQRFAQKGSLIMHIKNKHSNTNEKEYKCSKCSYQTNDKSNLKVHFVSHTDLKHFQCDVCKQRFGRKDILILHIKNKHSNTNEKEYKCSKCSYQTNLKSNLKVHLVSHTDVKDFQCDICKQRFGYKCSLKLHIKNNHSNPNETYYKCSECSYQTNRKDTLKSHLGGHTQQLQCDICKQRFGRKDNLRMHIKYKHSNTNEKEYKCSQCSHETNHKSALKKHLFSHSVIKNFECDDCKRRFTQKSTLTRHIKNQHSNTNEKEYKCSECSYQTNCKENLNRHLGKQSMCKDRFGRKGNLKLYNK